MQKDVYVDKIGDMEIKDPYHWLEDSNSRETKDWIKFHNDEVDNKLKAGCFNDFSKELEENFHVVNFSLPSTNYQGRYFYTERQPNEDQSVLYFKEGIDGEPVVLINPNGSKDDNAVNIDYWIPSKTGKYLVYGISKGGNEMATLYIRDIDNNIDLPYEIKHCRYSSVRWLSDDSGFFYTREPRPGSVPEDEEHLHRKLFFHKLGNNPDNDEMIFGKGRPKDDMISLRLSPDEKYLGIQVAQNWVENEIYIYDIETKETRTLITGISNDFEIIFLRDKVLLYTNHKANNHRVLSAPIDNFMKPVDEWDEFIPEKENPLKSVRVTKDKLLANYLVNVYSEVFMLDHDGNEIRQLPLPKYSSLAGISAKIESEEFFYGVGSFTFPKIVYRYNPDNSEFEEYRKTDNPINPDDYILKQEWYESKDGTKVPMFIFHKKNVEINGENPTILYGYGGFQNIVSPTFKRNWLPWMERGGIFAIANIRGGGEFGEKWHKGGIKENKQNSFDDFIASGEYLISSGYTDSDHLGIIGGSNGGLLVSAVSIQKPDLFRAVCSLVPLTDMVRFYKFGMAIRWVHEYGHPEKEDELKNILKWSPYHNVKEGVTYPDFLFTTADKDTRVAPLHAYKMAAALENANKENEVYVLTETEVGHGPGKPIAKIVEVQATILSFFADKLDLR